MGGVLVLGVLLVVVVSTLSPRARRDLDDRDRRGWWPETSRR